MNTFLVIDAIVSNIAVIVMIYRNYKLLKVADIANQSSYKAIKRYADQVNENRNLKEENRKLDERYAYLYEQYTLLQREYNALVLKNKKTDEESE